MVDFVVLIPARYKSQRFPGKLLAKLGAKEILSWVYEAAKQSDAKEVYIATDDDKIAELGSKIKAKVIMTDDSHSSGTSRIHEAAAKLKLADEQIILNLQGDEPLIPPANINQLANLLATNPECEMASLMAPIQNAEELINPNCVKLVVNKHMHALYFSRSVIPFMAGSSAQELIKSEAKLEACDNLKKNQWFRHIGIYAYRFGFLRQYVAWQECQIEQIERLEQLRAIHNGVKIYMGIAQEDNQTLGVDTPEDLAKIENLISN